MLLIVDGLRVGLMIGLVMIVVWRLVMVRVVSLMVDGAMMSLTMTNRVFIMGIHRVIVVRGLVWGLLVPDVVSSDI